MNKSHWLDGIVGIIRKASIEDSSKVFDVIDPTAVGADEETVRAITISVVRDDLKKDSSADLILYWKGTNENIYEKHFDTEKEALSAYKEMCDTLATIEQQIEDEDKGKAKEGSKEFLEYLDAANKKKVWDKSLKIEEEKKDDGVKIENKGTLQGGVFEFSNDYLVSLISPIDVVNTLPESFMMNIPSRVYNTHSFNHISKQNFSAWLYKDFSINNKKIASLAVIEKSTKGKPLYFITANCDDAHFDQICNELTPTIDTLKIKTKVNVAPEIVVEPTEKKADYYAGDVEKYKPGYTPGEEGEKAAKADNAKKPEENKELKGDNVAKNPDTKIGSIAVEAKKTEKVNYPVYTPQDNAEAGYRISDWDLQHPNEDMVAFETPLTAKFDKLHGLYEI